MQIVDTIEIKYLPSNSGAGIVRDNRTKIEKQKDKNRRLKLLMDDYNCLVKLSKITKLNEEELSRAGELLSEMRRLGLFSKVRLM